MDGECQSAVLCKFMPVEKLKEIHQLKKHFSRYGVFPYARNDDTRMTINGKIGLWQLVLREMLRRCGHVQRKEDWVKKVEMYMYLEVEGPRLYFSLQGYFCLS